MRGGFPELHANPEIDVMAFYNSYLATYLERDVRSLANVGSLRDFERFLRACALRSANLLNKADLARDVGVAPSTANHWLSTLEASGQIVLLEPWFSNRTKSIVKSPKLYLADTGLLCALLNIRSEEALRQAPGVGADLGNIRLCPTARARAPCRTRWVACSSGVIARARWTLWWTSADVWNCSKRSGPKYRPPATR